MRSNTAASYSASNGTFADHLFEGMRPTRPRPRPDAAGTANGARESPGPPSRCAAKLFERRLGGLDERSAPCGSDAAGPGLDSGRSWASATSSRRSRTSGTSSRRRGARAWSRPKTSSPATGATRIGVSVGDPYFSPSLSLNSSEPQLRSRFETTPHELASPILGRTLKVFRMQSDAVEAEMLAATFRVVDADERAVTVLHAQHAAPTAPKTINWFLPDIDSPFYGGVNTVLRLADYLARHHDVENRFSFWAAPNEAFFRSAISAAFPRSPIPRSRSTTRRSHRSNCCPKRTRRWPPCGRRRTPSRSSKARRGSST